MTLATAKQFLSTMGMKITKSNDEYRVNFKNGNEATAYYTDDLDDAVNTGIAMHEDAA